jgi:guanylate kinase
MRPPAMATRPLIIVSGPSGSGKSTLIHRVLDRYGERLHLSVSVTTRPPRPGEEEGKDYFFWTKEEFERGVAEGAFLEHAVVHGQHRYGTLRSQVEDPWKQGKGVILDIDVQGADAVRQVYPDHLSIFVTLPGLEVYRQRLKERGESEENIERRMKTAEVELARSKEYHQQIVNDDKDVATAEMIGQIRERYPGWLPD